MVMERRQKPRQVRKKHICSNCREEFATGSILKYHTKKCLNLSEFEKWCKEQKEYSYDRNNSKEIAEIESKALSELYNRSNWSPKWPSAELHWVKTDVRLWSEDVSLWISTRDNEIWLMPLCKDALLNKIQFERFFRLPMSCRECAEEDMRNYTIYSS